MKLLLTTFTTSNVIQLVLYLVIFVGIIVLTYFVTKWIAGYQKTQLVGKNFDIIETVKISNNKYLAIVRVGKDEYYVIGIGKEEVHLIGKLTKEQIIFGADPINKGGFSEVLASFKDNMKRTPKVSDDEDKGNDDEQ